MAREGESKVAPVSKEIRDGSDRRKDRYSGGYDANEETAKDPICDPHFVTRTSRAHEVEHWRPEKQHGRRGQRTCDVLKVAEEWNCV